MKTVSEQIAAHKIVPVVALPSATEAVHLADALAEGGLPVAEITFRTEAAEAAITHIAKERPGVLVGAGTITTVEQARRAEAAGARFLVTPGFSHSVTEYALSQKLPIFPGACTPTEMMMLAEYGLRIAKFFPAAQFGGLTTIKALAAPFPGMGFMPTGGVSENNILDYLAFPKVVACGGSWMANANLLQEKNFKEITRLTSSAVQLVASHA